MYISIFFIVLILIAVLIRITLSFTETGRKILDFFNFFLKGKDKGFSTADLSLLWRTARIVNLENKSTLFWSVDSLDRCIKFIAKQVDNPIVNVTEEKMQTILNNLYAYRTKIELEEVQKRRSLESTKEILAGQICILLVPNETTVYAKLTKNDNKGITLALFDASLIRAQAINWTDKIIKVYFWRQKDAGYIFSAKVISTQKLDDRMELSLLHSKEIIRTQKRKSVRAACNFKACMFPLPHGAEYNSDYKVSGGVRCIICDISEDGAMFFVKGKASKHLKMKLQFKINNNPIIMCGKIVRFIYDNTGNRSRVHFQCELVKQKAKNLILSYVYNITPDDSTEFMSTIINEPIEVDSDQDNELKPISDEQNNDNNLPDEQSNENEDNIEL